jgi:glyoxylase-like metal-dependent hydrolase (beta-lactamase superfamily II)
MDNRQSIDAAEIPKIIAIAPGFCVRQEIDNIAWIDMGKYGIVVDALERPELEGEVFGAIRATLGDKPVRFVLNTHTHYDHVALNGAFAREFGSEIINAQTATIPAAGRRFEGAGRSVTMLPMPGCHTEEDCVVWVQPEGALFTGDIFGWGCIPLVVNLRADTAKVLEDTYTRMVAMAPAVVIPGHGPLCTKRELERWLEYFAWLKREVLQAAGAGKSDAEIIAQVGPPEDMKPWWRFLKWKHADALAKMIKAVRKGWITADGQKRRATDGDKTPRR